ncbi:uncharacterized protein LOC114701469 isoform X2 [Peromyscus leucopus]|uniref:uncharacterized protein LOC114701469 isoform X2 n=1 Tax=Peromyscus leucopus TaxID=10041 RepID=UPI0010A0FC29|nr:uncharacterized protein LOC114701469 isoform X2 [Peromyscus leucopus]
MACGRRRRCPRRSSLQARATGLSARSPPAAESGETPRGGSGAARPVIGPARPGGGARRSGTSGLRRGGSGELSREAVKRVGALGPRAPEVFFFFWGGGGICFSGDGSGGRPPLPLRGLSDVSDHTLPHVLLPTPTPPESSRFFQILLHPLDSQVRACLPARPVHPAPQRSIWSRSQAARCERSDPRHPWRGHLSHVGIRGRGSEGPGAQTVGHNSFVLPAAWQPRRMSCLPKFREQGALEVGWTDRKEFFSSQPPLLSDTCGVVVTATALARSEDLPGEVLTLPSTIVPQIHIAPE